MGTNNLAHLHAASPGTHGTESTLSGPRSDARITMAAVGDILMDRAVQMSARALMDPAIEAPHLRVASGFERLFDEEVRDSLARADIVFANLETPLALDLSKRESLDTDGIFVHRQVSVDPGEPYDGRAYTGAGFTFNAHPALALALKNTGFNIVSTANNHSLDRGSNGVDLTIDALRAAGIEHIGTRRSTDSSHGPCAPHAVKNIKGVRIAFFAWTSPLNGVGGLWGSRDRLHQVSTLMSAPPSIGNTATNPAAQQAGPQSGTRPHSGLESITAQIATARQDSTVDLVVVSVHWGIQCVCNPSPLQRRLAHAMSNAGADIILGHHPHVLQPIERYTAPDGRQTLVAYSLGNFVSGYWRPWGRRLRLHERVSVILDVDITKRNSSTTISDVRYLPTISVSRTLNHVKIIQVAKLADPPQGGRTTRLVESSLHGKTGRLAWMSISYLVKNPFCALLSASDVVCEGIIALRLAVTGSHRRAQDSRLRKDR